MQQFKEELERLTAISAISGHEDRMISYLKKRLSPLGGPVAVDRSGNVTITFPGTHSPEISLLTYGHMDEVGLMVRRITDAGYLLFDRIGGPSEKTLRGQVVEVFTIDEQASYPGVIGTKAHHLTPDNEKMVVPNRLDMYIDVGAQSRQEVLGWGIDVGSVITYHPGLHSLGEHRVASKCLDNRAAVCLLLQVAEHLSTHPPKITVHIGFSVQEEFNVRGSLPMVHRLKPDMVVSVDCAIACDTPDLNMAYDVCLGKGPVVSQMNAYGKGPIGGLLPTPKFRAFLEQVARREGIAIQREAMATGILSDASYVQMEGELGTVAAHLAFPIRYAHCPAEVADLRDIEQCARLLGALALSLDSGCDFSRGTPE